ncbi:MAG: nucleotidyltransferase family protein [Candidatus Sericytochromatia bacterium]|nr:nucleotidyltransferase family protein [Candidatus Sericytochromatia bacterium]
MIPDPLLKTLLDHWDDRSALDWPAIVETYGMGAQPIAGLFPEGGGPSSVWHRQVCVEALGHLGTLQLVTGWALPFLVVKGVAWGATLWGDSLIRPARDLDIVIQPGDLPEWQAHLAEAGFVAPRGQTEWLRGRQIVQLHYAGSGGPWLNQVLPPWSAFWPRARPLDLGSVRVLHLDPADTLLYLAHHQVFRHAFDHELGWLDLAGWLRWAPPDAAAGAVRRSTGTHLAGSLSALAWAWRTHWQQAGLAEVPVMPWAVAPWARFAISRLGDWRASVGLSLALAQGSERLALLRAAPSGWQRWLVWRDVPVEP